MCGAGAGSLCDIEPGPIGASDELDAFRSQCAEFLHSRSATMRKVNMRLAKLWPAWLALGLALGSLPAQDKAEYTFGTTVVDSFGLQGRVYQLKPGAKMLPKFGNMRPVGSIYTTSL